MNLSDSSNELQSLLSIYAGERKIIKKYSIDTLPHELVEDEYHRSTVFFDANGRSGYGSGVDSNKNRAAIKAVSEALERYFSGEVRIDVKDSYENLYNAVHPDNFCEGEGLYGDFSTTKRYGWVRGKRIISNKTCLVLADQIFYPVTKDSLGYSPVRKANSSGVAAHRSEKFAQEAALCELIERDAILTAWYGGRLITKIPTNLISSKLQERVERLEARGISVQFYDFSSDSIPVVVCMFFRENIYPHFVSGASGNYSHKAAILKSFEEAQKVFLAFEYEGALNIDVQSIKTPADHGRFYAQKNNAHLVLSRLKFSDSTPHDLKRSKVTFADLVRLFDPISINLHQSENFSVVRMLSEKLSPIQFGFQKECLNQTRVSTLGISDWDVSIPHFFP